MFGYVVADRSNLTQVQVARYRECYCGLCRAIGQRHGQHSRLSLTYDMTFLVLLLDSLYEPHVDAGASRCLVHPVRKQLHRVSKYTEYAADLNVALAYYNCLDDWQDDHSVPKLLYAKSLSKPFGEIQERWPRQCAVMAETLAALGELEQAKSADLDAVSGLFGQLMAALFTPEEDRWQATLAQLGNTLGRFIYVMDACLDQRSDEHHKRYNPITEFERVNGSFDGEQTLTMLIGDCALAFERLPLEQDLDLLRNILYSGVWTKWIGAKQRNQPNRRNDPND